MKRWLFALLALAALLCPPGRAHEVRPAYLELREVAPETYDVLWKVPALGDRRLAIYAELPPAAELTGERRGLFCGDAYVERWTVRCPGGLGGREIRIAGLEATRTDVLVRVQLADGATQTGRVVPGAPRFTVATAPTLAGVAATYLALGVEHILLGFDHLLFVLALVLLVKGWARLLGTITTFTLAHSITLALATLGLVRVPGPPLEACIALSIAFVAAEVVQGQRGRPGLTTRAPWIVAFVFGLLHGLGFAGALGELGLPRQAIPAALLFFNLGVEVGQVAFIAVVLATALALRRVPRRPPAWARELVPYAIGSLAMYWVLERASGFLAA